MLKGNKGEWSEIYTLFKIIADRKLFVGDSELNKITELFYPIIKILRDESDGTYEYTLDSDLVIIKNKNEEFRIPIVVFADKARILLLRLMGAQQSSFSLLEIEEFLGSFNCKSLKSKSTSKSDIKIKIHDLHTGLTPELGFSIKSQLGSPSTLLNSSKATNFIYKVAGGNFLFDDIEKINNINSRSKIKDRIKRINELGGELIFYKTESLVFGNNLTLIDSCLPQIISRMLFLYFTSDLSSMVSLVDHISKDNPLNYNLENNHNYYSYKIKRFLTDIALGMMPAKVWNGYFDATGGYLIVKQDGDVLCYHIYNKNEFENYLSNNTRLDTPSSSKHDYGKIFKLDGELYFCLNMQIRFIK